MLLAVCTFVIPGSKLASVAISRRSRACTRALRRDSERQRPLIEPIDESSDWIKSQQNAPSNSNHKGFHSPIRAQAFQPAFHCIPDDYSANCLSRVSEQMLPLRSAGLNMTVLFPVVGGAIMGTLCEPGAAQNPSCKA